MLTHVAQELPFSTTGSFSAGPQQTIDMSYDYCLKHPGLEPVVIFCLYTFQGTNNVMNYEVSQREDISAQDALETEASDNTLLASLETEQARVNKPPSMPGYAPNIPRGTRLQHLAASNREGDEHKEQFSQQTWAVLASLLSHDTVAVHGMQLDLRSRKALVTHRAQHAVSSSRTALSHGPTNIFISTSLVRCTSRVRAELFSLHLNSFLWTRLGLWADRDLFFSRVFCGSIWAPFSAKWGQYRDAVQNINTISISNSVGVTATPACLMQLRTAEDAIISKRSISDSQK